MFLCQTADNLEESRNNCLKGQKIEFDKMVTNRENQYPLLDIGDLIILSVLIVYRDKFDFTKMFGVVLKFENAVNQNNTADKIFKGWFPRTVSLSLSSL